MYYHFTFKDGSNPYIAKTNKALWDIIRRYCVEQDAEKGYTVTGEIQILTLGKRITPYQKAQEILREFAVEWQYHFTDFNYSWGDLSDYQDFFTEYGKKYGLLREFHENAIC